MTHTEWEHQKETRAEEISQLRMAEDAPTLTTNTKSQTQEAQRTPGRVNARDATLQETNHRKTEFQQKLMGDL